MYRRCRVLSESVRPNGMLVPHWECGGSEWDMARLRGRLWRSARSSRREHIRSGEYHVRTVIDGRTTRRSLSQLRRFCGTVKPESPYRMDKGLLPCTTGTGRPLRTAPLEVPARVQRTTPAKWGREQNSRLLPGSRSRRVCPVKNPSPPLLR